MTDIQNFTEKIIENIEKVIIGKRKPVELAIISLLCQGHLLIEDVPGVGKTILARSLARSLGCEFSRIQFTPDMLPSDVTGVSIYNQVSTQFEFRPGRLPKMTVKYSDRPVCWLITATPKERLEFAKQLHEDVFGFRWYLSEAIEETEVQSAV